MKWNDKKHELTIADRAGQFPGMIASRKFRFRNMATPDSAPVTVNYDGHAAAVKL